jgi:RNA-directed DNA polymerase
VKNVLSKWFAKYGLTLHPEKTRLVEFGRYAEERAKRQGKKPSTFDFLGLTHICANSRSREVHSASANDAQAAPQGPHGGRRMVPGVPTCTDGRAAETLNAKFRGHYQYYGRPTNSRCLRQFYRGTCKLWYKWLNRRYARVADDVGEIQRPSPPLPSVATSDL